MTEGSGAVSIGVDSGASKTRVVALDTTGQRIGSADGEAATLNGRADTAWATIGAVIKQAVSGSDIDPATASVVVGIAGTEIAPAYRAFLDSAPAFEHLSVVSDAHIACAGAHALADGAIVSVGTGVVGFCRDGDTTARAGGWGFPHDDQGSGAWLGLRAVGHALAVADGRTAPDALAEQLLAGFDHDPSALSAWACGASAGDFASHARLVVAQAAAGSDTADAWLAEAGGHVSAVARALIGSRADLALALTGGLAAHIAPRLDTDLRVRLSAPAHEAAHGAALMAGAARHTFQETGS